MTPSVGIDLGTTRTKPGRLDEHGMPIIVPNDRGDPFTDSILHYGGDPPLVGVEARNQGYLDPARCVMYPKRKLGTTDNVLGNGQIKTATEAVADLLNHCRELVQRQTNTEIRECVVTHPANVRDNFKQALQDACAAAHLTPLKLVPEPTAAGIAYVSQDPSVSQTILVYDLGGGTFDVSILAVQGGQIDVLATEGVPQLGGNDFNSCIERRVLAAVEAETGLRPTLDTHALFFQELGQRVEQAKFSLDKRDVPIVASLEGQQVIVTIARSDFQSDIDPLIQQSLVAMDRAIAAAGLKMNQVDRLIMVGGSCHLHHVQKRVADHSGLVPRTDIDPDKAVVYGAALACGMEQKKRGGGQVIPGPTLFVRDITAHAVGCCVIDRSNNHERLVNSVIIKKHTPIPVQERDEFYLQHDDQREAHIEILQGEAEASRDDCLLIGELVLDNLPPEPRRTKRIQVEYTIDANGMVTATALDKVSGQTKAVSVDYKKGIKPRPKPQAI